MAQQGGVIGAASDRGRGGGTWGNRRHRQRYRRRQLRRRNRDRSNEMRDELLAQQFSSHSYQILIDEAVKGEARAEKLSEHIKRFRELEMDIRVRTVYVTSVLDLHFPQNLAKLWSFMEAYGPVEACFVVNPDVKFPAARVRFRSRQDVERLLKECEGNMLYCPVGCNRGRIRVKRSFGDAQSLLDLLSRSIIQLTSHKLAIGHWISGNDDTFIRWSETKRGSGDEWYEETFGSSKTVAVSIDLDRRLISFEVQSKIVTDTKDEPVKEIASFRFKDMDGFLEICKEASADFSIIVSTKSTPKLFMGRSGGQLVRNTTFDNFGSNFGKCLSFKLSVTRTELDRMLLSNHLEKMKEFGLLHFDIYSAREARTIQSSFVGSEENNMTIEERLRDVHQYNPTTGLLLRSLLDRCKFSWYHALYDTDEPPNENSLQTGARLPNMFDRIRELNPIAAQKALRKMMDGYGRTKYPCKLFCKIAQKGNDGEEPDHVPEYCAMIPRVMLSISRCIVLGVEVEMSNRVIRHFVQDEGFQTTDFLRLRVCDECGDRLFSNHLTSKIVKKLKSDLVNGIMINGFLYHFLAYSSSQLKELGVWMVAPPSQWSVAKIREELGDFRGLSPSKYAARIGQCFSTTVQTLPNTLSIGMRLNPTTQKLGYKIKHFVGDDIKSIHDNKEKIHSDGTGIIASDKLKEVLKFGGFNHADSISIIQIRYGGAKGTLTGYDIEKLPDDLKGKFNTNECSIMLRPSMIKFDAAFSYLEVCRVGTHVPYYLNRNVILLLSSHGVAEETFIELQRRMLDDLDTMMTDRLVALRMVSGLSGPDSEQRKFLRKMLDTFSPRTDPFLFSCLLAIRSHHLHGLRKKGRIFVEKGSVLLGSIDETQRLPEGCIFVQCDNGDPGACKPVVGPVMVTKHPVMHPGDTRMLLAVDIPELRHLRNVIIFSQKGSRPEADKMAGSDLDGDEFAVTWDERLFLTGGRGPWCDIHQIRGQLLKKPSPAYIDEIRQRNEVVNYPAHSDTDCGLQESDSSFDDFLDEVMKNLVFSLDRDSSSSSFLSTQPKPAQSPADSTTNDILDHFFNFAQSDSLGAIAMLWQDYAALKMATCSECITLAELHSIAVDFAKSGRAAAIPFSLLWSDPYAHWREKKNNPSYHCTGIIGQLYDAVLGRKEMEFDTKCRRAICGRSFNKYGQIVSARRYKWQPEHLLKVFNQEVPTCLGWPLDGGFPLKERFMDFAYAELTAFENQLASIMTKFHIANEGEFFTGCVRKYHKLDKRRQNDVAEDIRRHCRSLRSEFRAHFFREVYEASIDFGDGIDEQEESNLEVNESDGYNIEGDVDNDGGYTPEKMASDSEDDDSFYTPDRSEEVDDDGDDENDYAPDQDTIKWVEMIASNPPTSHNEDYSLESLIPKLARRLAAAYYVVSYSPLRSFDNALLLFSFPWIVADIIASGLPNQTNGYDELPCG